MQDHQGHPVEPQQIDLGSFAGALTVPAMPSGVIVFADGAADREIAQAMVAHGFAALLLELLRPGEVWADLDLGARAERLTAAIEALRQDARLGSLPTGVFATGINAAAAIIASTRVPLGAVVSRAGRVDLADAVLPQLQCPMLLLVAARDTELIDMYHRAVRAMSSPTHIHVIGDASAVHEVTAAACAWFRRHVGTAEAGDYAPSARASGISRIR